MTEDGVDAGLTVAFVPGVTLTKWTRAWAERRPDVPLTVTETSEAEQVRVLRDGRAELSFVRLPDRRGRPPRHPPLSRGRRRGRGEGPRTGGGRVAQPRRSRGRSGADRFGLRPRRLRPRRRRRRHPGRPARDRPTAEPQGSRLQAGDGCRGDPDRRGLARRPRLRTPRLPHRGVHRYRARPHRPQLAIRGGGRVTPKPSAKQPSAAKATQPKAKRPAPSRGAAFAQQRKNAAARKKHRPH